MRVLGTFVFATLLTSSQCTWAAPLTASLHGSLTGTVQNSDGVLASPISAVHARILANDNNGVITATLEGVAANTGALGLAIEFTAQFDAATQAFTGLYSDTPGQVPDIPLQFSNIGGLSWSAAISGNAPSASGERAYNLNLNLFIEPSAIYPNADLPADRVFSGILDRQQNFQLPVNLPALQSNQTLALEMKFAGDWQATTFTDASGSSRFTGFATGTFTTLQASPLTIVPAGGSMTVPVVIGGSFSGALFSVSDTELAFKGAWVSNNSGQSLGGDISISVPLQDVSRFPFTMNGTAQISTGATQIPTVSLPFSASGEFPLTLNNVGSGGSGGTTPGTPEPNAPVVTSAVKIKHLGVNLASYDPLTNRAGDFVFTRENMSFNLLFFNFGFIVPANSVGSEKVNPQPTFILPMGTKVHALIDGEVISVTKLYSNDYSVMLQGEGSDLIFELEHVINVIVRVGDRVQAGDIVAEVSGYDAHNYAGMGLVEIGILRGGVTPTHLCPFDYLDDSIREATLQNITALQQAWEAYRGNSGLYDESKVVVAGCYRRTPVEG